MSIFTSSKMSYPLHATQFYRCALSFSLTVLIPHLCINQHEFVCFYLCIHSRIQIMFNLIFLHFYIADITWNLIWTLSMSLYRHKNTEKAAGTIHVLILLYKKKHMKSVRMNVCCGSIQRLCLKLNKVACLRPASFSMKQIAAIFSSWVLSATFNNSNFSTISTQ